MVIYPLGFSTFPLQSFRPSPLSLQSPFETSKKSTGTNGQMPRRESSNQVTPLSGTALPRESVASLVFAGHCEVR